MPYDNNNLRGVLFRNEKKTKENSPDYTGSCEIGGTYQISAWIKTAQSGRKFMSLAFTEKEKEPVIKTPPPVPFDDEDVPF